MDLPTRDANTCLRCCHDFKTRRSNFMKYLKSGTTCTINRALGGLDYTPADMLDFAIEGIQLPVLQPFVGFEVDSKPFKCP